ncbi:MAG: PilZ domain-containing protein [Pseudomonadota bacterium]
MAPKPEARPEPLRNVGRRRAARLRLSIPARLITVSETRRCVLLDVSRNGAQIGLRKPLEEGEAGLLQFSRFETFGCAVHQDRGLNGLEFDVELSDADVLEIRGYAENYAADKRADLMNEARAWVMGS